MRIGDLVTIRNGGSRFLFPEPGICKPNGEIKRDHVGIILELDHVEVEVQVFVSQTNLTGWIAMGYLEVIQ